MTCRVICYENKKESEIIQLIGFSLGYSWANENTEIRPFHDSGIMCFYSKDKVNNKPENIRQEITHSQLFNKIAGRTGEKTTLMSIAEFSLLTKEDV